MTAGCCLDCCVRCRPSQTELSRHPVPCLCHRARRWVRRGSRRPAALPEAAGAAWPAVGGQRPEERALSHGASSLGPLCERCAWHRALAGRSGQRPGCARAGCVNHVSPDGKLELPGGDNGEGGGSLCTAGRAHVSGGPEQGGPGNRGTWACRGGELQRYHGRFRSTEKWMRYFSDDAQQRNLRMCWVT